MKKLPVIKTICMICLLGVMTAMPLLPSASSSPADNKNGNTYIIAVVKEMKIPIFDSAVEGFVKFLEKQNINAQVKVFDKDNKNVIPAVKEIKPVVILAVGSSSARLIADEIKDIPVVFSVIMDTKSSGMVSRNIIGASVDIPASMQLKILKSGVPSIKRIGVVYNPGENEAVIREAQATANELGFILKTYPVHSENEIPDLKDLPIDLLWVIPDTVVSKPAIISRFIQMGLKYKIAVMGFTRSYARSGALLGLSCDYEDIGRQAAEIVLKLAKGEKYVDQKTTIPRKVDVYISKTAADLLKIPIPDSTIKKAREVF
jgi:putative tryptophan/tyrosine transport system substrate-binding protein